MLLTCMAATLAAASAPSSQPAALPVPTLDQTPEISWQQLKAYLEAAKENVVIVDFWATWCIPCREALPDLSKIAAAYKDKHVRVLLVSFDDVEDAPAVRDAMAKSGLTFGSYILTPQDRTTLVKAIHPDWKAVVLPASFVYDTQGRQLYHKLFATHSFQEWQAILDPIITSSTTTLPNDHKP
jgi:thiol-disulfide isomerase/thioredoxin